MHVVIDRAREVHAEEWETRIGHGVDRVTHQSPPLWQEFVVLTTKRDDHQPWVHAADPGQPIRLQASASHEQRCAHVSGGRCDNQRGSVLMRPDDPSPRADLRTPRLRPAGEGGRNLGKVHHPSLGNPEAGEAGDLRLELAQLLASELPDTGDAYCGECREPLEVDPTEAPPEADVSVDEQGKPREQGA